MPPLALTPEEFLVLFPSSSPAAASAFAVSRPAPDPAAALRASEVLPLDRLSSVLSGAGMAPFAWLTRLTAHRLRLFALPSLIATFFAAALLFAPPFAAVALFAPPSRFPAGRVAAGTVAASLYLLAWPLAFLAMLFARQPSAKGDLPRTEPAEEPYRDLYAVRIANGPPRWVMLADGGRKAGTDDPEDQDHGDRDGLTLLFHDPASVSCPCPRPTCTGGRLPRGMVAAGIGDALVTLCTVVLPQLAMLSTPMVSFAGPFWTTPWSAALGALALLGLAAVAAIGVPSRSGTTVTMPMIRFQGMLQRRAVAAGLCELMLRMEADGSKPSQSEGEEPYKYQIIHDHLSRKWFNLYNLTDRTQLVVAFLLSALLVSVVLSVAVGSCITLWQLLAALTQAAYLVLELVYVAESNLQITAVTDLYRAARTSLRLLASATPYPSPALAAHEAVLSSFLEVDGYRLRAFGTAVSYGSLRGLVATAATVMLGLWSVGRAAGIGFTVESVCPA
ncbi:hypothetical protein DFJ74DRAFT_642828 [Hyaloraphidium curvatum]|nr:hypothetical protein DFJ74DRAFT_642828 [Hyaloraphidium curvatum]